MKEGEIVSVEDPFARSSLDAPDRNIRFLADSNMPQILSFFTGETINWKVAKVAGLPPFAGGIWRRRPDTNHADGLAFRPLVVDEVQPGPVVHRYPVSGYRGEPFRLHNARSV